MDGIRRHRTRFTLIELLAVVALISVLMAVGVPAFARMLSGNKVAESARGIKLGLEQAQMRAASERSYVAVIFPNGIEGSQDPSASINKIIPYRLGGFRTAYVRKQGNGGYEFSRWLDPEWRNAPNGAILTRVGTSAFTTTGGYITDCTASANEILKGASDLKAITGVRDDSGNQIDVGQNIAIIFTPYGGTVGGAKLYLLVSEAVIDGNNIKYPAAGTSDSNRTSNYKVLKVNNLTGRVEFYE